MKTLKPASLSAVNAAYERLRKSLIDGAYRPGQRLKALRIASEFGISRTPVKEALSRLEQEGLVKREFDSGFVVRELSVSDILNLYRVRELLEVEAAREAIRNLSKDCLQQMREALKRADALYKQKRFDEFLRVNREFHSAIAAQSQNQILQEMLSSLNARFWSIGRIVVSRNPKRAEEIRRENYEILEALTSGDVNHAERAVRAHVRAAADNVKLFMKQEPRHLLMVAA